MPGELLALNAYIGALVAIRGAITLLYLHSSAMPGELLALNAYIGALVAIRRGYNSVVPALFSNAR